MPKTMAVIENNIVTNIIWCNDDSQESEDVKEVYDRMVRIGDTYHDGQYYRDGELVLSAMEQMLLVMRDMHDALEVLGVTDDYI